MTPRDAALALLLAMTPLPSAASGAEAFFNRPFCERCSASDKKVLLAESPLIERVEALLDEAERSIDIAQFSFSDRRLEAAVLRAHERGVSVRLAIHEAQNEPGRVATRLAEAGVPVRFVAGKAGRGDRPSGLQHNKFLIVDGDTLVTGSMNWSSTGLSINSEHAVQFERDRPAPGDAMLDPFACHFEAVWRGDFSGAGRCGGDEVFFSPSSGGMRLVRATLREASESIDVLMHHLLFDKMLVEMTRAARRGVRVRILLNAADVDEAEGGRWEPLLRAGAELRFKRNNEAAFQLMHHKFVVVDGRTLVDGSGNWSGSAFFNNYENWWRSADDELVASFRARWAELWELGLDRDAVRADSNPALERHAEKRLAFGTLHAHHVAADEATGRLLDDGRPLRLDELGVSVDVSGEVPDGDWARYAYERADDAGLDFLALTPHTSAPLDSDGRTFPNMSEEGYAGLVASARRIEQERPDFGALAGAEWSTNGSGNHIGVLGSDTLPKEPRGEFRALWDEWLPAREAEGERPVVVLCHPRTYPGEPVGPRGEVDPELLAPVEPEAAPTDSPPAAPPVEGARTSPPDEPAPARPDRHPLAGTWDQVFGVPLSEVPRSGERGRKFNDYGLDEESPVREARAGWIAGEALPDRAQVDAAMASLAARTAPWVRGLEVFIARGNELGGRTPTNPSLLPVDRDDPDAGLRRRDKIHADWDAYLLAGFRIAPVAPHDNHYANWGEGHTTRTVASIDEPGAEGVLEALRRRAVYATEDPDLALRFHAEERILSGGSLRTTDKAVTLSLLASDPSDDGWSYRVFRGRVGGAVVESVHEAPVAEDGWIDARVALPAEGTWFLYLELQRDEGRVRAVTAPIWVRRG